MLPYRAQPNGMPLDGELDRVSRMEDQLIASLEGRGAIYVGHVTSSGAMRVVFYGRGDDPKSVMVKTGLLKKEEVAIEWRQDSEWTLYDLELQPTAMEGLEDRFGPQWKALPEHGDNHDAPRQVDLPRFLRRPNSGPRFLRKWVREDLC